MSKIVTATFMNRFDAESVVSELENINITEEQISLVMTDETRGNHFTIEEGNKMDEGAAAGATAGGIFGGVLASLMAATAIAIPGLNLVVAGTLISALTGIGAGATAGGIIGALVGLGLPEHEAKLHDDALRNGAVLLAVEAKDGKQKDQIKEIFDRKEKESKAA